MPEYLAPGVYVEEIPGTPPISGVGTNTAAFIGVINLTNLVMPLTPDGVEENANGSSGRESPILAGSLKNIKVSGKKAANYVVTIDSLKKLQQAKDTVSDELFKNLKALRYKRFPNQEAFLNALRSAESGKEKSTDKPVSGKATAEVDKLKKLLLDSTEVSSRYPAPEPGKAYLVTNFNQFITQFGTIQEANRDLAHAVYGFFENGGSRAYVAAVENFENAASVEPALKSFEKYDDIAIVAAPGALNAEVQNALIDHCEKLRDRFAILDGQKDPAEISVAAIQGGTRTSDYAALYFPWLKVPQRTRDPLTNTLVSTESLEMAPSAHLAGIYSRVDKQRGVHKAPANEVLRGVNELTRRVTQEEQGGLNPLGINVIRQFGNNATVWGARTLGGDDNGEFKYINVRRLVNYIRESISKGTRFAVFEPNARPLWQKLQRSATDFLLRVWRDGGLFGDTPEAAFYVKCDDATNPEPVIDSGQVITEIGIAVVKPAEFVIFRISQKSGAE